MLLYSFSRALFFSPTLFCYHGHTARAPVGTGECGLWLGCGHTTEQPRGSKAAPADLRQGVEAALTELRFGHGRHI
jgi:hypothetical protein